MIENDVLELFTLQNYIQNYATMVFLALDFSSTDIFEAELRNKIQMQDIKFSMRSELLH